MVVMELMSQMEVSRLTTMMMVMTVMTVMTVKATVTLTPTTVPTATHVPQKPQLQDSSTSLMMIPASTCSVLLTASAGRCRVLGDCTGTRQR